MAYITANIKPHVNQMEWNSDKLKDWMTDDDDDYDDKPRRFKRLEKVCQDDPKVFAVAKLQ